MQVSLVTGLGSYLFDVHCPFNFFFFFRRDEMKNLTEITNNIKKFKDQIENGIAKRGELLEDCKSLEGQLVNKRNELSSVLESCQSKSMELERYV